MMPNDSLTQLLELAAIPELTKGFASQQDCIAWANKVVTLLSFNKELQNTFSSYQMNINTIGLSANLQGTSLNQMVTILHSGISQLQEIERSRPKSVSDELLDYADIFENICSRFIEGNRNKHLSVNDDALFRRKLLEAISLIRCNLGEKNIYEANLIDTVNSNAGQFGPSLHCVQSVRGVILAAQKEIFRKETSIDVNKELTMLSSNEVNSVEVSSKTIEDVSLMHLMRLMPIRNVVGIVTVIFGVMAASFYFGFNVRTWQTDKALYDLNKENRELKEKLEKLQKGSITNQRVNTEAAKGNRPTHP